MHCFTVPPPPFTHLRLVQRLRGAELALSQRRQLSLQRLAPLGFLGSKRLQLLDLCNAGEHQREGDWYCKGH